MRSYWLKSSEYFLIHARNGKTIEKLLKSGKLTKNDPCFESMVSSQAINLINQKINNVFSLVNPPKEQRSLLLLSDAKEDDTVDMGEQRSLLLLSDAKEDDTVDMGGVEDEEEKSEWWKSSEEGKEEENEGRAGDDNETTFNFSISDTQHASIVVRRRITDCNHALHSDLNILDQWPKECHKLDDREFQKYLYDWLKSKQYQAEARFPPDSTDKGKEWNNDAYNRFLGQVLVRDKSRIHRFGCFVQDGYCLNAEDLLLFPGLVHFNATRDGYEVEVWLGKRKASTLSNIISPLTAGCGGESSVNNSEYENDTSDDSVYIVPEEGDLLRNLNDSLDNKQVFIGMSNRYTFIFKAMRSIVGVSSRIRKENKRPLSSKDILLDQDGELTLNYGADYFSNQQGDSTNKREAAVKAGQAIASFSAHSDGTKKTISRPKRASRRKSKSVTDAAAYEIALTNDFKSEENTAEFFINLISDDEMDVIEDFTPPKRPEEISTLLFQKFIVFDSSNIRLFTFSKEEIQYLKEMKCGWFYFELDEALHLGDFSSCEEKIKLFHKINDIKLAISRVLDDFMEKLNEFLNQTNCEEVKRTDIRLTLIPLLSKESPPMVHQSEGYCSMNHLNLIAYTFVEKIDIEVRDHNEYLYWIWLQYKNTGNLTIDENIESKNAKTPITISMDPGKTLILHKSALFKFVNRHSGDSLWGGKLYAFVSHIVDLTWEGTGSDVTHTYEQFYRKCQRADTAGRYPWGQDPQNELYCWPRGLVDAAKVSYGKICLQNDSDTPCGYDFKKKPQVVTDMVANKINDVVQTIPLVANKINDVDQEKLIDDTSKLISMHLKHVYDGKSDWKLLKTRCFSLFDNNERLKNKNLKDFMTYFLIYFEEKWKADKIATELYKFISNGVPIANASSLFLYYILMRKEFQFTSGGRMFETLFINALSTIDCFSSVQLPLKDSATILCQIFYEDRRASAWKQLFNDLLKKVTEYIKTFSTSPFSAGVEAEIETTATAEKNAVAIPELSSSLSTESSSAGEEAGIVTTATAEKNAVAIPELSTSLSTESSSSAGGEAGIVTTATAEQNNATIVSVENAAVIAELSSSKKDGEKERRLKGVQRKRNNSRK